MITKRIIPCLDVKDGRVVKGVNFSGLRDVSDPVELAKFYNASGADELVFYDIAASVEGRPLFWDVLEKVASQVFIPLTVGGSITCTDDFARALSHGADKVSVNTGAITDPSLIGRAAEKYGSQCVVLSMDVRRDGGKFMVFRGAGKIPTGIEAGQWAARGEALGAGELVINSIDTDGVKNGFDIEMLNYISSGVSVPLIASGGAGKKEDFAELFRKTNADAGLAASIFHFGEVDIRELKHYLLSNGIPART